MISIVSLSAVWNFLQVQVERSNIVRDSGRAARKDCNCDKTSEQLHCKPLSKISVNFSSFNLLAPHREVHMTVTAGPSTQRPKVLGAHSVTAADRPGADQTITIDFVNDQARFAVDHISGRERVV